MVVEVDLRVRFRSDLASAGQHTERVVSLSLPVRATAPAPDASTPTVHVLHLDGKARHLDVLENDRYQAQASIVLVGSDDTAEDSSGGGVDGAVPGGLTTVVGLSVGVLLLGLLVGCVAHQRRHRDMQHFVLASVNSAVMASEGIAAAEGSSSSVTLGVTLPGSTDQV